MRKRPVSKFRSYTSNAFVDYSQGVHDSLSTNVGTFPTPSVTLADQQTAIDTMQAAVDAWGVPGHRGSHQDHLDLIDARNALEEIQRSLCDYVDGVAAGSESIISLAGMVAKSSPNPAGVLPAPQNLHSPFSKHTVAGEYRLRWKKVKGAAAYIVYMSSDGIVANKQMVTAVSKTIATILNPSLPSGTLQYFWVSAIGAAGEGVLSDVCTIRNP